MFLYTVAMLFIYDQSLTKPTQPYSVYTKFNPEANLGRSHGTLVLFIPYFLQFIQHHPHLLRLHPKTTTTTLYQSFQHLRHELDERKENIPIKLAFLFSLVRYPIQPIQQGECIYTSKAASGSEVSSAGTARVSMSVGKTGLACIACCGSARSVERGWAAVRAGRVVRNRATRGLSCILAVLCSDAGRVGVRLLEKKVSLLSRYGGLRMTIYITDYVRPVSNILSILYMVHCNN